MRTWLGDLLEAFSRPKPQLPPPGAVSKLPPEFVAPLAPLPPRPDPGPELLCGARGRQTRTSALMAASRIYASEGRYGAAGSTVIGMAKVFEAYIIGGH